MPSSPTTPACPADLGFRCLDRRRRVQASTAATASRQADAWFSDPGLLRRFRDFPRRRRNRLDVIGVPVLVLRFVPIPADCLSRRKGTYCRTGSDFGRHGSDRGRRCRRNPPTRRGFRVAADMRDKAFPLIPLERVGRVAWMFSIREKNAAGLRVCRSARRGRFCTLRTCRHGFPPRGFPMGPAGLLP